MTLLPPQGNLKPKNFDMKDYANALNAEDYPNAIAIWDGLAEAIFESLVRKSAGRYQSSLPAIVSSFMPKAGGTFLYNRMIKQIGYVKYYWGITHKHAHSEVYPTPKALEVYRRGGFFCHSHALPTPFFRMILEARHVQPIWVHIRHPGETTLAGYYHYQGEGQGRGEVQEQRLKEMKEELDYLRDKHGFTIGEWPEFFRRHVGFYSRWIEMWLNYEDERPGSVFFTYFDELKDTQALLNRVFRTYGLHMVDNVITDDLPEDRRRISGAHDWTEGLSEEDIASQQQLLAVWDRAMAMRERQNAAAKVIRPKAQAERTGEMA